MKISKKKSKAGTHQTALQDQSSSKAGVVEESGSDLLRCDGFQLKIPQAYSRNIRSGKDKQWEYGEFFSPFPQGDQGRAEMEGVFYYWTKDKRTEFKPQTVGKMCQQVIKEHLFEAGFQLQLVDSFVTKFGSFPAMVLRYRYKFKAYQANGPLHLFVVDNLDQKRMFILGVLTERSDDSWREAQTIQFLEDAVVMSFEFC